MSFEENENTFPDFIPLSIQNYIKSESDRIRERIERVGQSENSIGKLKLLDLYKKKLRSIQDLASNLKRANTLEELYSIIFLRDDEFKDWIAVEPPLSEASLSETPLSEPPRTNWFLRFFSSSKKK